MLVVNMRGLPWKVLGPLAFAAASASCGFPSPEACDLACGEEDACPDGFECQAETKLCVPHGTRALCLQGGIGPARPLPPAGGAGPDAIGGQGGGGSGGDATAGGASSDTGGASGSGGGAGGSGPLPGELDIVDASSSRTSCTGAELERSLRASGGVGPYTWRVLQAPAGVEHSDVAADLLELTGVATEPGVVEVELEDAAGTIARFGELVVYETPQIANQSLPAVCSGEPYEVQLIAAGGQSDAYVWSVELAAGAGLPDTLDGLGLTLGGSTLSGELDAAGEGLAPFRVVLAVSDGRCTSSEGLDVDVIPAESEECPSIGIVDAPLIDALPPPCLGNRYTETLTVEGGVPPYEWTELSTPPGLSFDVGSGTIQGIAEGNGVLAVALTDATSRTIRKSYDVQARDKCWLAYVSTEPAPPRLELVDGRLLRRQPDDARRTLPSAPSSDGVVDFAFSPDGRFIALRLGPDASALRLELLRLSDGEARELELGGSVTAYTWSPDSATLAVAFAVAEQTRLGGVDVAAVPRAPAAPGTPLGNIRPLASRDVSNIDSGLTWFDGDHLAFLSRQANGSSGRRLVTTALEPAGFAAPATHGTSEFSDGARLLEGAGGVFVAEPETGLHAFFASDGRAPLSHAAGLVVSPSGALAGLAREGDLQIFRPSDPSGAAAVPFLGAGGCTTLLAWASGRDRIACTDERNGRNQVALFDVPRAGGDLTELALIPEPYLYPVGEHMGRRRLLSPSGRWFAFATDDDLFVARSDERATGLVATVPETVLGIRPGALAFSPDEAFLLVGAGNSVGLFDLERGQSSPAVLSSSAAINDDCGERFVDGATEWCGRQSRAAELAWSNGSDLVAFRSSLGTLLLMDVSLASSGIIGEAIAPDTVCSEACRSSNTARFQP
jgi:WD40 repeat protein